MSYTSSYHETKTPMNTPALKTVTLYDTMTREKRPLDPIEPGKISMYVCGVTVYDLTHIGHARTFSFFDVVHRVLEHLGYDVKFVRNHTDVDDKIIKRAQERGIDPLVLSAQYIDAFHQDMGALGVGKADVEPKVSEHMPQIISMVQTLVDKGFAYEAEGDVYFRVREFEGYGKLSGRKLEDMEAGRSGRVDDDDETCKEYPFDFALWKSVKPGEISWESPWGQGRPGWHIECSAMSLEHLGSSFDIHGGGADLEFPHHENEIAQSECATGCCSFARNWMHVAMLNVDGVKMGKSLGNFWTTRDVLERYHPEAIRFFMSTTHYRRPINYSVDTLNDATRRLVYMYETLERIDQKLAQAGVSPGAELPEGDWFDKASGKFVEGYQDALDEELANDFNTPNAITLLHEAAHKANELTRSKKKPKPPAVKTLLGLRHAMTLTGSLLGLLERAPVEALERLRDLGAMAMDLDLDWVRAKIAERDEARAAKDWARADAIRDEVGALRNDALGMSVELMDSPEGTTWRIRYDEIAADGKATG